MLNDGGFLVADGYCNSRIMRFHPNGTYHSQYQLPDERGRVNLKTTPGGVGIGVAHSLVVDECDGDVLLADKENGRVHVFDLHTTELKGEQQARLRACGPSVQIGHLLTVFVRVPSTGRSSAVSSSTAVCVTIHMHMHYVHSWNHCSAPSSCPVSNLQRPSS